MSLAMWSMLLAVRPYNVKSQKKIARVACPGLGTATGRVPFELAACQMALAYRHFLNPPEYIDCLFASKIQQEVRLGGDIGLRPGLGFRSSIPCPPVPLFTLRLLPRDSLRKIRGQDGSLLLSCETLSFSTSCRFIPAHEASLVSQPSFPSGARARMRTNYPLDCLCEIQRRKGSNKMKS
jgi:hypothetical protein